MKTSAKFPASIQKTHISELIDYIANFTLGRFARTPSVQDDRVRYGWKLATGEYRGKQRNGGVLNRVDDDGDGGFAGSGGC